MTTRLELYTFRDDCCRWHLRHLLLQNDCSKTCCMRQLTEVVLNVKTSVVIVALLLDCVIMPHPHSGGIKRWCASVVCLSDACIGPKSRTQRLRKTKIGKEVAHVTRDSGTAFKVERSKVNLQGRGHIVAASRTACYICLWPRVSFRILLYWHIFDSYFLLRLFFVNIT